MGNKVQGKNITAEMKVGSNYYPILCGQTLDFNIQQEMIEVTNVNSGAWRDYEAGMSSGTCQIGGVTILDNSEGRIADGYLLQTSVRRTKQDFKVTKTDDDGDTLVYTFKGLIEDNGFNKAIGSYSKSNITIRICGPVATSTIPPPPSGDEVVYGDYWNFSAGNTSISGTSVEHGYDLIDKVVLSVDREGTGHDIITSGTPGNRECKHNDTTGDISFDPTNPSNGETVYVVFKEIL